MVVGAGQKGDGQSPDGQGPDATLANLRRGAGPLATAAVASMDERLGWFRQLAPGDRSWVGLVAQAGIAAFLEWYAEAGRHRDTGGPGQAGRTGQVSPDIFGTAPREL